MHVVVRGGRLQVVPDGCAGSVSIRRVSVVD